MSTGKRVNYEFVNRAFGGIHPLTDEADEILELERSLEESQEDIDPDEVDEQVSAINLVRAGRSTRREAPGRNFIVSGGDDVGGALDSSDGSEAGESQTENDNDSDEDDEDQDGWGFDVNDNDEDSEDEIPMTLRYGGRKSRRGDVELDTPCSSHTRVYRGHCNIKTVKDVNFFGLNDEYVVSGSDSGHLFIWDRKSASLVNILEGDSEVVNVIQGKSCD